MRLIVPGYYAENQIKYIRRLAFTEQESAARMMARDPGDRPRMPLAVMNALAPFSLAPKSDALLTGLTAAGPAGALDDLLALAERHVVMAKGEIVFDGTTAALRADEALIHRHLGV